MWIAVFIILALIVLIVLASILINRSGITNVTGSVTTILDKDYPSYKKTYENICSEGITVELPKGSIGSVAGVNLPPNNIDVKVKVPCAPID